MFSSKSILLSLMTCYLVSCIVVCFVYEDVSLFLKSRKYSHFFFIIHTIQLTFSI